LRATGARAMRVADHAQAVAASETRACRHPDDVA
jgi:hypothetical protein